MKLKKLNCPNCNGELDIKINDENNSIFCPYCGQKFFVDTGKKERTVNKNISINKNVNYTRRNIDEADVIRAKTEAKEKKNGWIFMIVCFFILVLDIGFMFFMAHLEEKEATQAIADGKLQPGTYSDYEDKNYEAVVEQFELMGFTNVSSVDLDDAGIAVWKSGKVESVSIGGKFNFSSSDYFDPNDPVIVSYH